MDNKKNDSYLLDLVKYIGPSNVKNLLELIKEHNICYVDDFIDIIITSLKRMYDNNLISEDDYEICLGNLCKYFNKTISDLNNRIDWLFSLGLQNTYGICKNHDEVYEIFDAFNKLLNYHNIEHYYTSGILSYILVNNPLERYHHDLDVFVNEKCLEELEKVSDNFNFSFIRKIGDRPDGTKRRILKMYYKDYDIPITVFMYSRQKDGSIIQKDYFYDENGILKVEDIYNSPKCVELSFSELMNYHNNIPYKAITLEALYLSKSGHRPKDIYDCSIIFPFIDNEKLKELEIEINNSSFSRTYEVLDSNIKKFINGNEIFVKKYSKGG